MVEMPPGDRRIVIGGRIAPGLTGRMVLGLIIIALGALWTLDNLDIVESEPILRWWPIVLVAVGLAKLVGTGARQHTALGVILVAAGGWLLAEQFGLVRISVWDLWPLALVAIGFGMLSRSMGRQREVAQEPSSRLSAFAFMSGVVRKVTSPEFQGGEVTAVMGGVKLDLRGAKSAPQGAVIDVFVCWGGIDIVVPDHWKVVNEATVLLGGLEDRSKTPPPDARDTLILRGLVMMGGIEIKN